jgi:hypothetical protein
MPERISSVVEVAPNALIEVAELFAMLFTPAGFHQLIMIHIKMIRVKMIRITESISV